MPTVAHAGDGNLHPHVIYDETDAESVVQAHAVFAEIMHAAIDLGGTITGEHGVGRAKAAYLADQLGPDVMGLTRSIKSALDPLGILNPGAGIWRGPTRAALPAAIALSCGKSPVWSRAMPYATAAATIAGSSSAILARARDSTACRALPDT